MVQFVAQIISPLELVINLNLASSSRITSLDEAGEGMLEQLQGRLEIMAEGLRPHKGVEGLEKIPEQQRIIENGRRRRDLKLRLASSISLAVGGGLTADATELPGASEAAGVVFFIRVAKKES